MYPVVDLALKLDSADYEATETHFDLACFGNYWVQYS